MTQTLGMFMEPLAVEFGWTRAFISSGIAVASVTTAILSPFFGIVIDRFGPRRVALPGIVTTTVAVTAFSLTNGSPTQWILLWGFYAVISISVKTTVWTTAIVKSFTAARGMALGIMLTGTAVAQAVLPALSNMLIDEFGWRMAYIWLGGGFGVLTFALCYLFLEGGRKEPDGQLDSLKATDRQTLGGLTISEAMRDPALWRIAISTLIMMILSIGLLIHQIPILTAAGISRTNAAWLAGMAGIAGIAGKIISGALLDKFNANWVGGLTLVGTSFAFILLINDIHTPLLIVIAMLISGYSAGSKLQIASYLTARYGGLRNFGVIYGIITSAVTLGSGLGPLAAGLVYDQTGGYSAFLWAGAVGSVLCGLIIATLPRYPDWTEPELHEATVLQAIN